MAQQRVTFDSKAKGGRVYVDGMQVGQLQTSGGSTSLVLAHSGGVAYRHGKVCAAVHNGPSNYSRAKAFAAQVLAQAGYSARRVCLYVVHHNVRGAELQQALRGATQLVVGVGPAHGRVALQHPSTPYTCSIASETYWCS